MFWLQFFSPSCWFSFYFLLYSIVCLLVLIVLYTSVQYQLPIQQFWYPPFKHFSVTNKGKFRPKFVMNNSATTHISSDSLGHAKLCTYIIPLFFYNFCPITKFGSQHHKTVTKSLSFLNFFHNAQTKVIKQEVMSFLSNTCIYTKLSRHVLQYNPITQNNLDFINSFCFPENRK